jgi:quercetin dioxygenase-like cupin family protein
MHVYRATESTRVEPAGHFGGLEVSDVVDRATGGNFVVQLSYCPPGGGGEMHEHAEDSQLFLVMEGELAFDTGSERFTLGPHEGVLFEPGEPHATLNESGAPSLSVVVTVRK